MNYKAMYQEIIDYFYGEGESKLKTILMVHSRGVANKALRICDAHPELKMNREFVEHFGSGSWQNNSLDAHKAWLEQHKDLWL